MATATGVKMVEEKYVFLASWLDKTAQIDRGFYVIFFPRDGSVELYERSTRRCFLKRTLCDTVSEQDFYVDNVITVLSRKMCLTKCLNENENSKLKQRSERSIIILRGDAKRILGKILADVTTHQLVLVKLRELLLTHQCAILLQKYLKQQWVPLNEIGNRILFMEILGKDCLQKTCQIISEIGNESDKKDILYQSPSTEEMTKEGSRILMKFSSSIENTDNLTCCIIKPHAVKKGLSGNIISDIESLGFKMERIQMADLDVEQSEAFLEVYQDVVPEYQELVTQLSSGLFLVMALTNPLSPSQSVESFRSVVGPSDSDIARHLRPRSLRAKYGTDNVRNAVHCTDLAEDGPAEVRFFFSSHDKAQIDAYSHRC